MQTWIWSFQLNGVGARVKALLALWLISLKFMQLFTLTYDSDAIDSLVSTQAIPTTPKLNLILRDISAVACGFWMFFFF